MSIRVIHYGSSGSASVPLRQYINNSVSNVLMGMPDKPRTADGTTRFAKGRMIFNRTFPSNVLLIDLKNRYCSENKVIRVDNLPHNYDDTPNQGDNVPGNDIVPGLQESQPYNSNPSQIIYVKKNDWSTTKHTLSGHRRNQIYTCGPRRACLVNGKQNQIISSDELIQRKKNNAIGRGSMPPKNNQTLSFNANNLNGNHTNYLETTNAKRRTRNSGYVVPPKCRGGREAPVGTTGWPVTPLFNS